MIRYHSLLVLAVVGLVTSVASAEDHWPMFRGPNAVGIADGLELPTSWDATDGRNVHWKTAIPGLGHASPVVWGDRIFIATAVSDNPDSIFVPGLDGRIDRRTDLAEHTYWIYALDRGTGDVLWKQQAHRGVPKIQRHRKNSYASPTPVTDGERVVTYFGSEGVYAFDFDGKLTWSWQPGVVDAGASYDDTYDWGPASSPILFENLVILVIDQQNDSFMVALDKHTGELRWRVERNVISSFSTPAIYRSDDRVELITNGAEWMHGYDPRTGKLLWKVPGSSKNTTPTPVVWNDLIFITSGYRIKPIFALRPGGEVVWSTSRDGSYMTTPVVYGGLLYTCQNNGVVTAYDAKKGERIYQVRMASGAFSASPIAADGKLFFWSEEGDVYVVRAGAEYELLETNPMGEVVMATPAATQGQWLIRTQHHLFSIRSE